MVAPLGAGAVAPGEEALVQLVSEQPLHAVRGDRFILRDQSARTTLGGGVVLDPLAPARGRARPERIACLRALALAPLEAAFATALAVARHGLDTALFGRICNLDADQRSALLLAVPHRWLATASGGIAIAETHWCALLGEVLAATGAWHQQHPRRQGPDLGTLARTLPGVSSSWSVSAS